MTSQKASEAPVTAPGQDGKPRGRMTLGAVVERLTEPRTASATMTAKIVSGKYAPELTVTEHTTREDVERMADNVEYGFARLMGLAPSNGDGGE